MEACWRTFEFELYGRTPPVQALPVHLEHLQRTTWVEGSEAAAAARGAPDTELTHWLEYIRKPPPNDPNCRALKYIDFPANHTYNKKTGWSLLKKQPQEDEVKVGRIHSVHPSAGERFFLRCLLNHVTGETLAPRAGQGDGYNFETLRNVPGRDAPAATYREACELRGLSRTCRSCSSGT